MMNGDKAGFPWKMPDHSIMIETSYFWSCSEKTRKTVILSDKRFSDSTRQHWGLTNLKISSKSLARFSRKMVSKSLFCLQIQIKSGVSQTRQPATGNRQPATDDHVISRHNRCLFKILSRISTLWLWRNTLELIQNFSNSVSFLSAISASMETLPLHTICLQNAPDKAYIACLWQ